MRPETNKQNYLKKTQKNLDIGLDNDFLSMTPKAKVDKWSCINNKQTDERLLLNDKTPRFLASGGDEFNPGPETRLDHSKFCVIKFY